MTILIPKKILHSYILIPIFVFTASSALNFFLQPGETNLTLSHYMDTRLNDSCPPYWYRAVLNETITKKTIFLDPLSSFTQVFENLTPYTEYKLTISTVEHEGFFSKSFATLEGCKDEIVFVYIFCSSLNSWL